MPKDTEYLLQFKIIVYRKEICFIDSEGFWVTKWGTRHSLKFIVPKKHIPIYTSHPVAISEYYGRIHLLQDTLFIKNNRKKQLNREVAFKTKPLPKKETKTKSK